MLEVTEDRGIESGGWDLERQITLPSAEWVGADLKKRTGVRIEESFFPMLSACLREVLGQRARRGASEGYTESAKNLERGVRADPRRQGSMEVSSIEGLLACLGPHHSYWKRSGAPNKYEEVIGLANQVWEVFLGEMLAPEKLVLKALKRLHEHVQDEFDVACTWRRSARFLTRCIRKTGFLQSRKEERLVKNRRTSKGNSVDVSVKKPVESTGENRLKEVVQIQGEEGKDSLKKKMMKNTCNERKQPEIVPVKGGKKKHSGSKKSKAQKTVTKAPNHGQKPVQTQKKALVNRVKRSGNEKEERVVRHTESKRVRLEEEVKPIQAKEVSTEKKEQSTMSEEKKDCELLFQEVKEVTKSSRLSASSSDKKAAISYRKKFFDFRDFLNFVWWRENKEENAETTLGDSKSVGLSTVDEAVKEKACAKRNEDLLADTDKEMINTHCMK